MLSVVALSYYSGAGVSWRDMGLGILRNPLIIAILLALTIAALQIPLPAILLDAGNYLGAMALPLALLGTGAGMSLATLRQSSGSTVVVVLLKAVILPAGVTMAGWMLGLRDATLGVLFLLFCSPSATASYAMVKAMGGNDRLASNLIMTTTLACIFTCSGGLFVLAWLGLA